MQNISRAATLLLASALTLVFSPTSAEAQKALVYCPTVDVSGCSIIKTALGSAFPGGVDGGYDGSNGTVDLSAADLFQYSVFIVPSLAETDSTAPYDKLRETAIAARLKAALIGRRAFWSGTPDQGVLSTTRPQKDVLLQNLAAWASADFGTVNAPGLVVLQDNSTTVTQRYSWVQAITGLQVIADSKLVSYSAVTSLTAAGNAVLNAGGSTLAYTNMASFGFQAPTGGAGLSMDAVGKTGTSVGGQVVLITQSGANTGGAVVTTDKDDYAPGTTVVMTGTGFGANETVTLLLHEDPTIEPDFSFTVQTDANGGFVYSGFSPDTLDVDVRFILKATGQTSGRVAQTTFTDAVSFNKALVVGPQNTNPVAPGSSTTFGTSAATSVRITFNGNNSTCNVLFSATGLPTGATASFNPASLTTTTSGDAFTLLTVNTTASTPGGSTNFTVVATGTTGTNGCDASSTAMGTATLVVTSAKQNQTTAVTVTGMPSSAQQFGTSFTVGSSGGNGSGAYNFSATGACTIGLTTGVAIITASAGTCSITAVRLGDATFNDSPPSAAATVSATVATQPAVMLTVPASVAYPSGYTASASGGVGGATYSYSTASLACSVNQSSGVVTINSVGTCAITAMAKSDNYADATVTQSTTVTPGSQPVITLTVPATATYPVGFTASASGGAAGASVSFSTISSTCSVIASSGVVTITGIGPCAITATATAANYADATATKSTDVVAATTTTTISISNATYDGAPHGGTATATGPGGLSESVQISYVGRSGTTYPQSTTAPTNAGDYTATASYAAAGNYLASSDSKDFSIGKATATITVSGFTGSYDGAAHGATGSATGIGGASLSGLTLGASFTNVPGGTVNWTFTDASGNYTNASGTVSIVITKADPSINVVGYTGTYDGVPHGATGTATGAGGATLVGLNLGASFTNAPGGSANWSYTDASGNYNNASGSVAIAISKADPTIVVDGYSGVYDGAAHGATGTAKGIGGVTLTGLNLGASFTNVPGGTATWTFTDVTGNYKDATGLAAIVISKASAAITVTGYTGVYDGLAHGATGSATGVGGVTLAGLSLGASFINVPGGNANWTFTDATGNYNDASGAVAIVINKADATIAVIGYAGVYDGNAHGATGTAKGVLGESLAGLDLGASFTSAPGGAANWAFTDATGNYKDASGSAAITISKADATVTVNGYTGTYDGVAHGASGSATGVKGESLTGLSLGGSFTDVPGGTASWSFTDVTGNYNNSTGSAAIVINKATPTVTAAGGTFTYDGVGHPGTGFVTGVGGAALTPVVTLSWTQGATSLAGAPLNAGTYAVVAAFAGNSNYLAGNSSPAAITIDRASSTTSVTCAAGPFIYTGSAQTPCTASATGVAGLNQSLSVSYVNNVNAGIATASAIYPQSLNYLASQDEKTFTISKATIAAPILSDLVRGYTGGSLKPTVMVSPAGVQVTLSFAQDGVPKGSSSGVIPVGVYNVVATITDANYTGDPTEALFVIYDPSAGFVTGGGWIDSPVGAYARDPSLSGKANFGFVSKYQKGATVPTGNTEFQFKEGNLNFKSTNFQWLVIQGASQAQFKGTGTINGIGNYNFLVTAIDGDAIAGTKKPDAFRIKITLGTDVVYDNKMGEDDTSPSATNISGGSIQIQSK